MATQIKPTTKNSPAIHRGANRDNLPAESYAPPHPQSEVDAGWRDNGYGAEQHNNGNDMAVSIGAVRSKPYAAVKTDGITMRGHGAAVKGIKSRGPMA